MIRALRQTRLAVACLGTSFVLLSSGAFAAPPASPQGTTLATSLTGDAKASYESGKLLLEDHDFAGASTKFRAAYDSSHDARLLWNIAVCEKELRHYARASVLVDRFLKEASTSIGAEQLAQAQATQTALKSFFSLVTVTVQPDGSDVSVDGESAGKSPLTSPIGLDLGKHTVHIEHDGYAPQDLPIEITGQNAPAITVTLTAKDISAYLAVHPSDPVDTVTIDNKVVGQGAWQGTLPPGDHQVKVTADGKQPYLSQISVAAGEHRSVDVTLENEKKSSILPWLIGGGVVVVAGAVVGGYFLFKPKDSTYFPSSSLQTVQLSSLHVNAGRR